MILAQSEEAVTNATDMDELVAVLIFSGLLVFGLVAIRVFTKKKITVTFARLYGLMGVAALGVVLATTNALTESKTAAFTLLGTVAGYLAGAKPTTVPGGSGGGDDSDSDALEPEGAANTYL